jgi:hypothetical protein
MQVCFAVWDMVIPSQITNDQVTNSQGSVTVGCRGKGEQAGHCCPNVLFFMSISLAISLTEAIVSCSWLG